MAYGIIGYGQPGNQNVSGASQPSGNIWGDCSSQELIDEGTGYFLTSHFAGATSTFNQNTGVVGEGTFTSDTSAAGTLWATNTSFNHVITGSTGSTGGSAVSTGTAFWTQPLAVIAPGSGTKLWFEAAVNLSASTISTAGLFVGLVNRNGMTKDFIKTTSATSTSNVLGPNTSTSFVGFWFRPDNSASGNADIVYSSPSSGSTTFSLPSTGGIVTVLASTLTANANNPNTGNPFYTPAAGPGIISGSSWSSTKFVTLGLRYDGQQYIYFYVNGNQVAKLAVAAGGFDTTSKFGGIVAIGAVNGTTPQAVLVDFVRVAAKVF